MPPPRPLDDLLRASEILGAGFAHLRIDFYVRDDDIFIGEITVYSWSRLSGLYPRATDAATGALWTLDRPVRRAVRAILWSRRGVPGALRG